MKKNSKQQSLEELMNKDASDSLGGSGGLKLPHDKTKRNMLVLAVVLLVVFALVVAGLVFVLTTGKKKSVAKDDTQYVSVAELKAREAAAKDQYSKPGVDKKYIPFDYSVWQRGAIMGNDKDFEAKKKESLFESFGGTSIYNPALLSGKDVETDFKKKTIKKDGVEEPNPNWVYWDKDIFMYQAGKIVEKFVNPIIGGWRYNQLDNGEMPFTKFENIMTPELFDTVKNKPAREWMPLFHDKTRLGERVKNTYYSSGRGIYYGKVKNIECDIVYSRELGGNHTATITVEAEYAKKDAAGKVIQKTGKFKLHVRPNFVDFEGSEQRVLVDRVELLSDFGDGGELIEK